MPPATSQTSNPLLPRPYRKTRPRKSGSSSVSLSVHHLSAERCDIGQWSLRTLSQTQGVFLNILTVHRSTLSCQWNWNPSCGMGASHTQTTKQRPQNQKSVPCPFSLLFSYSLIAVRTTRLLSFTDTAGIQMLQGRTQTFQRKHCRKPAGDPPENRTSSHHPSKLRSIAPGTRSPESAIP